MKASIKIGCNGRMDKGIVMCSSTHNTVVDLRRLSADKDYVLEYLEKHCKLFDVPAVDLNKIANIIKFLYDEGILVKQVYEALYNYVGLHKKCGLYLYIDPIE